MNTGSLRFQLLSWYIALLVGAFAVFGGFMRFAVGQFLEQNLETTLTRRARQIAHTATASSDLTGKSLSERIGTFYAPELSSRFVRITKEDGSILYQSGPPEDASFDASVSIAISRAENFRVEGASQSRLLVKSLPVSSGSNTLLIEVGAPLAPINVAVNKVIFALALGAPALIFVAAIGARKLIGHALSPVIRMARSAEDISLHNLSERLPVLQSGDELETLTVALNRMISRIQEAIEQNRRFVADASHELRTPIAILRGELENVVTRNHLSKDTRDTLGSNLEEVERLGKIVEGLFALSRLDAGEAQGESVVVDLAKLAMTTTEQMDLLAEDKSISLTANAADSVYVRGDSSRLKQVIVNLIDNAIKYTGPGGQVTVWVGAKAGAAILEVRDNGIGIPRRDLPHIFERFYRVDKTRSRDFGGAGLGLSIVKSICSAHAAEVEVASEERQGSVFTLRMPLAEGSNSSVT
jgi:heavy metal sensor kinase